MNRVAGQCGQHLLANLALDRVLALQAVLAMRLESGQTAFDDRLAHRTLVLRGEIVLVIDLGVRSERLQFGERFVALFTLDGLHVAHVRFEGFVAAEFLEFSKNIYLLFK